MRALRVIEGLPAEFSTRQFIWKFADDFEPDYIEMLFETRKNETVRVFHSLHSRMGSYLQEHASELHIVQLDRREVDVNPFGRKSDTQMWAKR